MSFQLDCRQRLLREGVYVGDYYSLPAWQALTKIPLDRLPRSLQIVLEAQLRRSAVDISAGLDTQVRVLAGWQAKQTEREEMLFPVARIVAPDASGIPLLADLAAMRDAAVAAGYAADVIEPMVPVDLIVDHSLHVERAGTPDALSYNMQREMDDNSERYAFLKWGANAFKSLRVIPPGAGIIHQVNIEYLSPVLTLRDGLLFPDSVVGPDSHTSMINGIGVLGWGVGGIEAEAVMLGLPLQLATPEVVGVELRGALGEGITATDLVLYLTQRLRAEKVVGCFVEFFGDGVSALSVPERCTLANMAPEYGATVGYFPVDGRTLDYLLATGREPEHVATIRAYFEAQKWLGVPDADAIDYSRRVVVDLTTIHRNVAGPGRPQDRVDLAGIGVQFSHNIVSIGRKSETVLAVGNQGAAGLHDGSVVIAAITSCSNTSNPRVLIAAGLLARNAARLGLRPPAYVKTSFTPGSRIVTRYLEKTGLIAPLEALGFHVAGYGCATCMGNSGPLNAGVEAEIRVRNLTVSAVLSGNRNFEARIHPAVRANYLMSPPLVVACAIAGRIDLDIEHDVLAVSAEGCPVRLRDLWPADSEIDRLLALAHDPVDYQQLYSTKALANVAWSALPNAGGMTFDWDPASTYLRRPPFLDASLVRSAPLLPLRNARALAILGDSVTTDHISPASSITPDSVAGQYLHDLGEEKSALSNYVARRANHEVMVRGTLANVRLRNRMVPDVEGGYTRLYPETELLTMHAAAEKAAAANVPLVLIAGREYGTGSSRDWAAKGLRLLGVRAVVAQSFERIHRSNLVGMGVLPCEFAEGVNADSLRLDGSETLELRLPDGVPLQPNGRLLLRVRRSNGDTEITKLRARVDTPVELDYLAAGGILPYVFQRLLSRSIRTDVDDVSSAATIHTP